MKFEKFMCDVAKALLKEKPVQFRRCGNDVLITIDGYFAVILPQQINIFKCDLLGDFVIPLDSKEYEIKPLLISEWRNEKLCRVFNNGVWKTCLDERFLRYFDKNAKFYQVKENSAVFVEEHEKVWGVIMPIYRR